jgi:hypothetical protein
VSRDVAGDGIAISSLRFESVTELDQQLVVIAKAKRVAKQAVRLADDRLLLIAATSIHHI